jgi:hypothetical protein
MYCWKLGVFYVVLAEELIRRTIGATTLFYTELWWERS